MHKPIHYHLHCFRKIRRSIPFPIAISIASSYILPLFDHCNNILFNLPDYKIIKQQCLHNSVVRCIHLHPRRSSDSIKPILKQLHWLPVSYRIKYKLSLISHKTYIKIPRLPCFPSLSTHTHFFNPQAILKHLYLYSPHLHSLHSSRIRSVDLYAPY